MNLGEQFRQRLAEVPQPKTEESLVLRILVQSLVIVGIIATDVAAENQWSLWAIPLSIAGATWSWYRRKERNIAMKFLLAIAMIAVLVFFLSNLRENLGNTQVSLAQLLTQLQVIHSFDLPQRKDLGYSIVIGLILLGVAGTLSQTLAFAPWLLLFLAIALPTLILEYRSRLGLEGLDVMVFRVHDKAQKTRFPRLTEVSISPRRLGVFLVIILGIGLIIFAVMPRFPAYQVQSFPVMGPEELKKQGFNEDNVNIINPGYIKEGKNAKGGKVEKSKEEGPGEVDDTFYYGFNDQMNQNLRGTMTPKVIMRVRSQAPGFFRVMSFDQYTGQGWKISQPNKIISLSRGAWYQFFVGYPQTKAGTKRLVQTYTVVSNLPNVLPALTYPQSVYFPAAEIGIDPQDGLRAPFNLMEGLTYTVISQVPYRQRKQLGKASEIYPEQIKKAYLQIPPKIADRVRQKAEQLLAKSPNPLTSNYEKALFLAQAVKQNYQIKADLPFFDKDEDLVEGFLFRYSGGYPDHFSTVLTVMLRSLGIPARLTVGLDSGQFNPFTGYYIIKNTDAYALTEVYFPEYGWFTFDPIPGHELIPPSFEEEQTFSVLKQFWNWVASWLPSPVVSLFNVIWNFSIGILFKIIGWFWKFISGSLIGFLLGLMMAISLGFLGWLCFLQLLRWGASRRLAKLHPMERLYWQMLGLLKAKGYPKHPAQTPLEYGRLSRQYHPANLSEIIEEISQSYVSWRYGENPQNLDYLQQQLKLLIKLML
jgi:transglutaminase-like putative cysteine protease